MDQIAFEYASEVINAMAPLDQDQRCELLYLDQSGFSSNLWCITAGLRSARLDSFNRSRIDSV